MRTPMITIRMPAALLASAAVTLVFLLLPPGAVQGQEAAGEFIGELPPRGGVATMTWSGGAIEALEDAAAEMASVWMKSDGTFVGYRPGAPDFVNAGFRALFPDGQVPSQPMVVVLLPAEIIVCSTAYRISPSAPLTEVDTMRLGTEDSVQSIPYIYLEFHAEYTTGSVDGERALRLWVTPTAEEDVIVTQLFQLPQDVIPVNQFAGGHGFTGLTYAYDPVSGAELQYWCEAA